MPEKVLVRAQKGVYLPNYNINHTPMPEDLIYDVEDASKIVYENIPAILRLKLSTDEIIEILDIEFDFQQEIGIVSESTINSIEIDVPVMYDDDEMKDYIINNCAENDIYLTIEELDEILEAEEIYLKKVGILGDEKFDDRKYLN